MLAVFLGSINVGGNRVNMADLCAALSNAGFGSVTSVIASGNLLLSGRDRVEPGLATTIEAVIERQFGIASVALPRTAGEISKAIDDNPFAAGDPARVHIHWLESPPTQEAFARLQADHAGRGAEALAIGPGALYIDYVDGVGASKLTAAFIERRLGCRGTARNLRSLARILDRMQHTG
jgi:uncharacterized protein (DUF1697 family)